jgi:hypothetical protein
MTTATADSGFARNSRASQLRLLLALLAVILSFASVLRTQMVAMNDLYSRWYGTRELLLHGRSPYSDEVNREIQVAFYRHVLVPGEQLDQQRFAYPAYTALLLWPIAFLPFATVSMIALPLLAAAGAGVVLCGIQFLRWPLSLSDQFAAALLGLSTAPMLRALRFEQLSTLVVLFLVGGLFALSRKYFVVAGILLALATIKPQMALLTVLWLLLWSVSNWRERRSLALSFFVAMSCLLLVSSIVVPGWMLIFPGQLHSYAGYAGHDSLLTLIAGVFAGRLLSALLLAFTAIAIWPHRKASATSRAFQYSGALVLALSAIVTPTMAAQHNLVLFVPAVLLLLRQWHSLAPALRAVILCLLAWTPVLGIATLIYDLDPVRVLQMSAGPALAGIVFVTLIWLSPGFLSEPDPAP